MFRPPFLDHRQVVSLIQGNYTICDINFQLNQPTSCSNFSSLLLVVLIQLNMFRASSCPSSGATTTAVAASGLPSELGDSGAVGRGRARPRPTALLPPRSDG